MIERDEGSQWSLADVEVVPDRRGEGEQALEHPGHDPDPGSSAVALEVINTVRQKGDEALRVYTERFDGVRLESLAVSREEFVAARKELSSTQIAALERAIDNVSRFHEAQLAGAVKRFSLLIEPIVILVMGGIVGFVYMAFFVALFSVAGGR